MHKTNTLQSLAEANFAEVANRFADAGLTVRLPAQGILHITPAAPAGKRLRLLLSVGMHGDETAPIEMLARLLDELAQQPDALQLELMAVIGNPAAIAQGRRYVEVDLNRQFSLARLERSAVQGEAQEAVQEEVQRADVIMRATADFFKAEGGEKWHLDLHTAIRKSHYPTFAVVPDCIAEQRKRVLVTWLGGAGIGAVILNAKPAPTFSAYTATQFGAASCTAELGQIGKLGENDLSQFALTAAALDAMLRSGKTLAFRHRLPHVFHVVQEIVKRSDDFHLSFDHAMQNFTPLQPGTVIAKDGAHIYSVGSVTEHVVFPNPEVGIGQRAGLMVVRRP